MVHVSEVAALQLTQVYKVRQKRPDAFHIQISRKLRPRLHGTAFM